MKLTLVWDGDSGDLKRAFVVAKENDGCNDLRIEVDTDDCDRVTAKAMMQEVMDRCNTRDELVVAATAARETMRVLHAYNHSENERKAILSRSLGALSAALALIAELEKPTGKTEQVKP
jgi:hypothetical protein